MKFSTSTHPSDNAKALSPSQPIGQPHFRSFRFLTHAELTYIVLLLRAFLLLFWVLCEWWRKRGERSEAHRERSTQPIKINGVTVGIRLEHKVFTSIRLLVHLLCVRDSSDWNPIGHQSRDSRQPQQIPECTTLYRKRPRALVFHSARNIECLQNIALRFFRLKCKTNMYTIYWFTWCVWYIILNPCEVKYIFAGCSYQYSEESRITLTVRVVIPSVWRISSTNPNRFEREQEILFLGFRVNFA